MIAIDRLRRDADGHPYLPSESWRQRADERTKAMREPGSNRQVNEAFYKEDTVKLALSALFHHKCAYCECRIGVAGSWDVEHYRPKGRVDEAPSHPGYYWLAYEWTNFLPSCDRCNRRLTDPGTWDEPQGGPAAGKHDQFPLIDEQQRCHTPADPLAREQPLLLNPALDEPGAHLGFDIDGRVKPLSQRGEATRRICHLDRTQLREERSRAIQKMRLRVTMMRRAREPGGDAATLAGIEQLIRELVADDSIHAAVARSVLADPTAFGL